MDFAKFTKVQQTAVTSKGSNIIVSAGAGSGKTQVLTGRVVHFIKNEHYKLNEFLILTFTNLAAGEMKERIRKELTIEGLKDSEMVDYADICTFDSYALSIVKKYHFLLNVSSNVGIIDSNIINVRKRRIIEELFEIEYKKNSSNFKDMIIRFCFKDDEELRKLLLDFYNASILEIDSEAYIDNFINKFYSNEIIEFFKKELINKFIDKKEEIFKLLYLLPDQHICSNEERTLLEVYLDYLVDLKNAVSYEQFVTSIPKDQLKCTLLKGHSNVGEIKNKLKKKIDDLRDLFERVPQNEEDFAKYFISCKPFAEKLIEMIKSLDNQIKQFKNLHQVYEFQDIAKMALTLVRDNNEIRESIKDSYKMIMIDEYQDTSMLQEAFISLIENNNVYMVGDIKQSIYRFRNARCDIFVDKYNKYKANNGGIAIDLNTNFRSRKEVLDDINYIFKQIMSTEYGEANYLKEHVIEYGQKDYLKAGNKIDSSHLDVLVYKNVKSNEIAEIESNLIARDIINKINSKYPVLDYEIIDNQRKPILRPCRLSDFCILMDRGSEFDTYSKTFNEYKIPLHIEKDENISKDDIVVVLTNVLRLIKAIKDNDYQSKEFVKAFLSVSRSFLFEYTDQQLLDICNSGDFYNDPMMQKIRDLMFKYGYSSTSDLFTKIIFELDIYHKAILIGDVVKIEKYLNTFLNMFKSMSELDYTIDDFILFMECIDEYNLEITLSSTGSSMDCVKIMNIHKSKGLEFNIVYYSGLKKQFNRMSLMENFNISSKYGLIFPSDNPNDYNILKELNSTYEKKMDISEKIRLLYVALTRTREKMIILTQDSSYLSLTRELYKKEFDEYLVKNNILSISKEDAFKVIYKDFINKSITSTLFKMLVKKINYDLPYEYLRMSLEDKLSTPIEKIIELTQNENSYINEVKNFAEELLNKVHYKYLAVKEVFTSYVSSIIDINLFNDVVRYLGYEIDKKFYDQIKFDDDNNDITEKEGIMLLDEDISLLKEDELNPEENKESKFIEPVLKFISMCNNGTIGVTNLETYMDILDVKLNPEVLDALYHEEKVPDYLLSNDAVNNPVFDFNQKEEEKKLFINIKQAFLSNKINQQDLFNILTTYKNAIPFSYEISIAVNKLFNHEIDVENLLDAIKYTNYVVKKETIDFLKEVYEGKKDIEDIAKFNQEPFIDHFEITIDVLSDLENQENFDCENIMKKLYSLFKNDSISYERFIVLINCFNFEVTKSFSLLSKEEQQSFKQEDIDEIVVEKGELLSDPTPIVSFAQFLNKFINYRKFKHYTIDLESKKPVILNSSNEDSIGKLEVEEVKVNYKEVELFKASKNITLDAKKSNLEFGSKLHLAMEVTDFNKPDYSILDKDVIYYVRRFLSSKLVKDINKGKIYKEFEFFDDVTNSSGIIDLFIEYADHIDIIDYKTKHIDDESYDVQLGVYKKYILRKFNKPVKTYLYSLIDGTYKETLI